MIYTIENRNLRLQINSMGAELWSIFDKKNGTEHLWQGDAAYWANRAPVLFPHCGRLRQKRYIINNNTYESSIHGFAREFEYDLVRKSDTEVVFMLSENEETLKIYPYHFRLYTAFSLKDNLIAHSFRVENAGDDEMYFSIGYHTGYMLPFDEKHTITDYSLVFEENETPVEIMCDGAGLLSGEEKVFFENQKEIPLHDRLFPASFILSGLKSEFVSIVEKDTGKAIRVGIKDFPYVVFWGTPDRVKFVCIEPWYGLPDLNNTDGQFIKKPGILKLQKGRDFSCSQTIGLY